MSLPSMEDSAPPPKVSVRRPGSDRWKLASTTFPDAGPMVRIRFPPAGNLLRTCSSRRMSADRGPSPQFCLRPFGSDGQGPGEFEQATAQGRIVDPVIGADKFDRLAPVQRIGVEGFGSWFGKACGDRRRSHRIRVVEEK